MSARPSRQAPQRPLRVRGRIARAALALLMALLCGGASAQNATAAPRVEAVELEVDGVPRRYRIVLPAEPTGAPLLLALHDAVSSGEALLATTDLAAAATARGWAVAFPSSGGLLWDGGRTRSGRSGGLSAVDDVAFLQALATHAAGRFGVDAARPSALGFGNGAVMTLETLCTAPGWLTGAVLVAGLPWDYQLQGCEAQATPLLLLYGEHDPSYPPSGQDVEGADPPAATLSLSAASTFLAQINGCATAPDVVPGLAVGIGCKAPFGSIVVADAGHHWFSPTDPVNPSNLDASAVALAFLEGEDWAATVPTAPAFTGMDGFPRSWFLYLPSSFDAADPPALVAALHGRTGNGPGMAFITDLNVVAEREGFAAVYPESYVDTWNYTEDFLGTVPFPTSDVDYLKRLAGALAAQVPTDPSRAFVTGFSNGGFMTQRMACSGTDVFAGFAVVGATLPAEIDPLCTSAVRAPLLYMHGTDDASVAFGGTSLPLEDGRPRILNLPAVDTIRFWTLHNVCVSYPAPEEGPVDPLSGTRVVHLPYTDCLTGSDVQVYVIEGGGHNWPGVPNRLSEGIAGRVNQQIHASQEIWDFFEPLRLRTSPNALP